VLTYPAMLDVPRELVVFVATLLSANRLARGIRRGTRRGTRNAGADVLVASAVLPGLVPRTPRRS
jgi:hypothetical protein